MGTLHTSTENRIPTRELLLPGQEFCIGLPWERDQLPRHGVPALPPKAAPKGNTLDARVLEADPCAGWEIGACQVIRRLSPGSAKDLLAVRESPEDGEALVAMRRIDLAEVLAVEVQANARWASQFRHPNLARVYDCEVSDEGIFWVTALPSGASLAEIFGACKASGRGIPVGLALSTVYEAARGLSELHAAGGFAHALVSDQSVWVGFDGRATLSDVGLFRCIARKATWADFLDGMGPYLSPEQVLQGHMPDAKCDVFSLAAVLYECLAGEKVARTRTFDERIKLHQRGAFKPISSLNMAVGNALDEVMGRALSPDRKLRYPNAGELARALQRAGGAFMWQSAQRQRFVKDLFPDRLRREQVLLDAAAPEARPKGVTRRVPTLPAMRAVPPPLPGALRAHAAPRPVASAEPPASAQPLASVLQAPLLQPAVPPPSLLGEPLLPPPLPVRRAPPPAIARPKAPARPPSRWRAFFLFLVLLGTGAAWVYQSGLTWRQVDHAVWRLAKQIPNPDQLSERVQQALGR